MMSQTETMEGGPGGPIARTPEADTPGVDTSLGGKSGTLGIDKSRLRTRRS